MVEIPEGPFTMGTGDGDPDEGPPHPVYLQTFYMDLKEVAQAVEGVGVHAPEAPVGAGQPVGARVSHSGAFA